MRGKKARVLPVCFFRTRRNKGEVHGGVSTPTSCEGHIPCALGKVSPSHHVLGLITTLLQLICEAFKALT